MKKAILFVLVFVLTMCLMAGCRRGNNAESVADDVSNAASEMMPDGSDGAATDGDGIIGEDNGSGTGSSGVDNGTGNSTRSGGFLPIHH